VFDADILKPSLIFEGRAEAYQSGTPMGEIKNTRNIQNSTLQWQQQKQQQKVSLKMRYYFFALLTLMLGLTKLVCLHLANAFIPA